MATHSSILAWRIPWTEEPSSPQGRKESDTTERLHSLTHSAQCSWLSDALVGICMRSISWRNGEQVHHYAELHV